MILLLLTNKAVYTVFCSFVIVGAKNGTGQHMKNLSPETAVIGLKVYPFLSYPLL